VTGFTVRRAEPRDAAELVRLARDVGGEPGRWLISTSRWRSASEERRYLRSVRRSDHAAVFIAEAPQGIVGRLSLARDPHPASLHIADLGMMVDAAFRRQGVGTALLEAAVVWARTVGVSKLELHVFPHNEAAIALYEKFGFEREGYRRNQYLRAGQLVDAILMAYQVEPPAFQA
jgi:RimJ/RimL family protein N-acetyltransferase